MNLKKQLKRRPLENKGIINRLKRMGKEEIRYCIICKREFTVANRKPKTHFEIIRKSYSRTCSPLCSKKFHDLANKEYNAFRRNQLKKAKNNS